MKALLLTLGVLVAVAQPMVAQSAVPTSIKFCRTVESDGMFGQPAGKRSHCVTFEGGYMTDDANTFFGNPPETVPYKIEGFSVFVLRDGEWQFAYNITDNGLDNGNGIVLTFVD